MTLQFKNSCQAGFSLTVRHLNRGMKNLRKWLVRYSRKRVSLRQREPLVQRPWGVMSWCDHRTAKRPRQLKWVERNEGQRDKSQRKTQVMQSLVGMIKTFFVHCTSQFRRYEKCIQVIILLNPLKIRKLSYK